MKNLTLFALLSVLVISGCGSAEEPVAATSPTGGSVVAIGYEKGSKKIGDKGSCAVCMVNEGKQPADEEVKATLDYKDKTYVFCSEAEEAEFISNPKKYTGL